MSLGIRFNYIYTLSEDDVIYKRKEEAKIKKKDIKIDNPNYMIFEGGKNSEPYHRETRTIFQILRDRIEEEISKVHKNINIFVNNVSLKRYIAYFLNGNEEIFKVILVQYSAPRANYKIFIMKNGHIEGEFDYGPFFSFSDIDIKFDIKPILKTVNDILKGEFKPRATHFITSTAFENINGSLVLTYYDPSYNISNSISKTSKFINESTMHIDMQIYNANDTLYKSCSLNTTSVAIKNIMEIILNNLGEKNKYTEIIPLNLSIYMMNFYTDNYPVPEYQIIYKSRSGSVKSQNALPTSIFYKGKCVGEIDYQSFKPIFTRLSDNLKFQVSSPYKIQDYKEWIDSVVENIKKA